MAIDNQHHLKYKGRLQYGLFLKGIGLTMEEAIRFDNNISISVGSCLDFKWSKKYGFA